MPIKLNLLAEQHAAEEARRRDPVKRALWAGGILVSVMLLWAVWLQVRVMAARAELRRYEVKLQAVERSSKEALAQWTEISELETRLANLQRYSTNRFFCASVLDALQQLAIDDVRLVRLRTVHSYSTNAASTVKTNIVIPIEKPPAWQFWKGRPALPNFSNIVATQIAPLTNKLQVLKAPVALSTKIELSTNAHNATANVELTRPETAAESVVLTIKARDYGNPPGRRVDEFSKAVATQDYFAQRLNPADGEGVRLRERAIQPELDSVDPATAKAFVPFVIECRYREVLRVNE